MTVIRIFLLTDRLDRSEGPLARFLVPVIDLPSVKELSLGHTASGIRPLSIGLGDDVGSGLKVDLIGSTAPNVLLQGISFGVSYRSATYSCTL